MILPVYVKVAVWLMAGGFVLLVAGRQPAANDSKKRKALRAAGYSLAVLSVPLGLWYIGSNVGKEQPQVDIGWPWVIGFIVLFVGAMLLPRKWAQPIAAAMLVVLAILTTIFT